MNFDQWRHYGRGLFFEFFKRQEQAIEAYRAALRHNPDFIQAARCLGYLHAQRHEYQDAEDYYLLVLRTQGQEADTWFNLGYLRDQAGRHAPAIEAFQEAVKHNPKHDRAWYGLGHAHAALGQHEKAAEALQHAAELQPMNGHAWYALGMAYHHNHQPEKVKDVALHLSRFDPALTRRLVLESEHADLNHLIHELH